MNYRTVALDPRTVTLGRYDEPDGKVVRLRVSGALQIDRPAATDRHRVHVALFSGEEEVLFVEDTSWEGEVARDGESLPFGWNVNVPASLMQRATRIEVRLASRVALSSTLLEFDLDALQSEPMGTRSMSIVAGEVRGTLLLARPDPDQRFQVFTQVRVPDGVMFDTMSFRCAMLARDGRILQADDTGDWDNPPSQGLVTSSKRFDAPPTVLLVARIQVAVTAFARWVAPVVRVPMSEIALLES